MKVLRYLSQPPGWGLRCLWLVAWCSGLPAVAQTPTTSMLDVRAAAKEYVAVEKEEVAEQQADAAKTSTLTPQVMLQHQRTIDAERARVGAGNATSPVSTGQEITNYLTAKDAVLKRIEAAEKVLAANAKAETDTTAQRLIRYQKIILDLERQRIACDENGDKKAPTPLVPASGTAFNAVVDWYKGQTDTLSNLDAKPLLYPSSNAANALAAIKRLIPLVTCAVAKEEEGSTVAFIKGIGQGFYTGARVVPAVTVLADLAHFSKGDKKTGEQSALISSMELVGLRGDALQLVDSSAVRVNYLHPELSTFGAHLTLGICKHKKADENYDRAFIGLIWRGSYLYKQLKDKIDKANPDDTQEAADKRRVGTDHLMSNLTLEFVVPRINLSFFGGYTYQECIAHQKEFQRAMATGMTSLNYFNWGVRGRFNIAQKEESKEKPTTINVEVSFIQVNSRLHTFLGTTDPLVPVIRIGFTHRFFKS